MKIFSIPQLIPVLALINMYVIEAKKSRDSEIEMESVTRSLYFRLLVNYLNMLNQKLLVDKSFLSNKNKIVLAILLLKMLDDNIFDERCVIILELFLKLILLENNTSGNSDIIVKPDQHPKYMHWRQGRSLIDNNVSGL
jgi:hypothetical protein